MVNRLFFGDSLHIHREHIAPETGDLVHLDPPFISKRDYTLFMGIVVLLLISITPSPFNIFSPPAKAKDIAKADTANVLFEDRFEGTGKLSEAKWPIISGNWSIHNGVLTGTNDSGATTEAYILAGEDSWTDYSMTGQVLPDKQRKNDNAAGILVRVNSDEPFGSRYTISMNAGKNWVGCANDRGPKQWIGQRKFRFAPHTWYPFSVCVHGRTLEVSINGRTLFTCSSLLLTHGKIGLDAWSRGTQQFKDIRVTKFQ